MIPSSSQLTHYSTGHSTQVVLLISTTYKFCNHWCLHEVTAVIKRSKRSDLIYLLFWSFLESFHKMNFASSPLRQKHQETLMRKPSECSSTIKRSQGQSQNFISQLDYLQRRPVDSNAWIQTPTHTYIPALFYCQLYSMSAVVKIQRYMA